MSNDKVSPTSGEIDRLGERLRDGSSKVECIVRLDDYRRSFAESYEQVMRVIKDQAKLQVTGRPSKSTSSIVAKLKRESMRLSQMQDIAGCRVVVEDIIAQQRALSLLEVFLSKWKTNLVDRRRKPTNGYRAVHLMTKVDGRCIEIQIRTNFQHAWAEISEKIADRSDPTIKYGGGPQRIRQSLDALSQLVARAEHDEIARLEAWLAIARGASADTRRLKQLRRMFGKVEADLYRQRKFLSAAFSDLHGQLSLPELQV